MKLKKYIEVSTGHRLPNHKGGCFNFHGHNYQIEVIIDFEEEQIDDQKGFVIDFGDIKRIINDYLDHQFLIYEEDPFLKTVENLPGFRVVEYIPSVENIIIALRDLIEEKTGLKAVLKINETSNSQAWNQ
jgi:6-pyruvoyltetrahydropterin/6-carboxytetrahydropterin synthase